jgi:hypothetical protein
MNRQASDYSGSDRSRRKTASSAQSQCHPRPALLPAPTVPRLQPDHEISCFEVLARFDTIVILLKKARKKTDA